jgi:hypothetical protein
MLITGQHRLWRAYRERFGAWGIVDVDDCVNGASPGRSRRRRCNRTVIDGGSAGGYHIALTFRVISKRASYYGVSDLKRWKSTPTNLNALLPGLIGPYPERRFIR